MKWLSGSAEMQRKWVRLKELVIVDASYRTGQQENLKKNEVISREMVDFQRQRLSCNKRV